jgi:uncharacterized protein YukE
MSPLAAPVQTPVQAPARTYTVPKIPGDAAAVFRLADSYRELATAVTAARVRVGHVIADLSGAWHGVGHHAADAPVETFLHNAAALAAALDQAAAELDGYGHKLALAHHHHGWSLHKVLAVGAIVAVSTVAIVVTVGAASVVEAAAAGAAVDAATEAAGAAAVADTAAAGGLDSALEALASLRPLLAFVVPHLVDAEWSAGAMATYDEATTGHVQWRGVAETAATAFLAAGGAGKASALAGESTTASHLIQGTAWAGAAAGDDELIDHRLDPLDVGESFVLASGGTAARDALREHGLWFPAPDYQRQALLRVISRGGRLTDVDLAHAAALLRPTPAELRGGEVNLRLHEGPGHTIGRHIGKSPDELLARLRSDRRVGVASTYWDSATARDTVSASLRRNSTAVDHWLATGSHDTLRLRVRMPYDLGFAVDRRGTVRFARQAVVVLRHDQSGIVLVTSYPVIPRRP